MEKQMEPRIVDLPPMRVARATGFGPEPEFLAWAKLLAWARRQGIADDFQGHRFFGFNNPNPTVGSPNYGYEQWITVDSAAQADSDVSIGECPGGLYAVARCQGVQNIYETWNALLIWCEKSGYSIARGQCLEECLSVNLVGLDPAPWAEVWFDLHLPIAR